MPIIKNIYLFLIVSSAIGCLLSSQSSSISKPTYPESKIKPALLSLSSSKLINSFAKVLDDSTSDRKVSSLYTYNYDDSSRLLIVNVRVKRRDDFKLEAYGLLSKGLKDIYLENSRLIGGPPFYLKSMINNQPVYQSCIIPGSRELDEIDVRLIPLTSVIEEKSEISRNIFSKLIGSSIKNDYSCFVITFFPDKKLNENDQLQKWNTLLSNLQQILLGKG
jgi:hypothetical protein